MPVEAAGSEQGSRQQEETATRGKFISQRTAVSACRRTSVRHNRRRKRQPLLPMFGFARAAGPNHWPKERSAVKPKCQAHKKSAVPAKHGKKSACAEIQISAHAFFLCRSSLLGYPFEPAHHRQHDEHREAAGCDEYGPGAPHGRVDIEPAADEEQGVADRRSR